MKKSKKTWIDRNALVNAIIKADNTPYENLNTYNELILVFDKLIDLEIENDKYITRISAEISKDAKSLLLNVE